MRRYSGVCIMICACHALVCEAQPRTPIAEQQKNIPERTGRMAPVPRITERWGEHATATHNSVTRDATITPGDNINTDVLTIRSREDASGFDQHTLFYFDLSALPKSTRIFSATLRVYFEQINAAGDSSKFLSGYNLDLYRILDPDGRGMWSENQATLVERAPGVPWTLAGDLLASIGATPVATCFSQMYGYGMNAEAVWREWDVTSTVTDWVNGGMNQGFFLDGRNTHGQAANMASSEAADAGTRPYLEITYEGSGSYPAQPSAVNASFGNGQTFVTWQETAETSDEFVYRIYRHTAPITTATLDAATLVDTAGRGSSLFPRLAVNGGRLSTPFSGGPLHDGTGLYVYTAEDAGPHYYAVTSVLRGNENRSVTAGNSTGAVNEKVESVLPMLQGIELENSSYPQGRFYHYTVWLGSFDPDGRYAGTGYANRRSVPFLFRVTTPSDWDESAVYPLMMWLHGGEGTYTGSGHATTEAGHLVVAPDDYVPFVKTADFGPTIWFGYNSNYGTSRPPTDGMAVNYTERRLEWIFDWVLHRNTIFKVDSNRIHLKGGSMGGNGSWAFAPRHANLIATADIALGSPDVNWDTKEWFWGACGREASLRCSDGGLLRDRVNLERYVIPRPSLDLPVIRYFGKKQDDILLWTPMPPFLRLMDDARHLSAMVLWR